MRRPLVLAIVLVMILPITSVADSSEGPLGWVQSAGGFADEHLAGHVVLDDECGVVGG